MENKTVSRLAIALLCVVGLALLVFIGFIVIIVIACGQYKPPVAQDDYEMPALCLTQADPTICATLPPRLPVSSYWTDGAICYEVTRSGLTVDMKGYSLHEGGMSCTMDVVNDNRMFQVMGDEGAFATEGSLVTHHRLVREDQSTIELLVAWSDTTLTDPIGVLERFDGNLEAYAERAYYCALAGLYTDEKDSTTQWLFTTDGRIRDEKGVQPMPYKIERAYHCLTNIIAYPFLNPKRIGFVLTKEGLRYCGAAWNEEEEYWETDYTETGSMIRKEAPNWLGTQLFCLPMQVLMEDEYTQELMKEAFASNDLFTLLNGYLMHYYLYGSE